MKLPTRQTVADMADMVGVCFLVAAGWSWNSILGMALAGVGLIALGAVVDK